MHHAAIFFVKSLTFAWVLPPSMKILATLFNIETFNFFVTVIVLIAGSCRTGCNLQLHTACACYTNSWSSRLPLKCCWWPVSIPILLFSIGIFTVVSELLNQSYLLRDRSLSHMTSVQMLHNNLAESLQTFSENEDYVERMVDVLNDFNFQINGVSIASN